MRKRNTSLEGISATEQAAMLALLKMPPEGQKSAPKSHTNKGLAQRRRRENEAAKKATSSD
jgi:hypothetical protein